MESFLQRAEMTFFLVKRGMQKNDAAAIRPYLNDGVFNAGLAEPCAIQVAAPSCAVGKPERPRTGGGGRAVQRAGPKHASSLRLGVSRQDAERRQSNTSRMRDKISVMRSAGLLARGPAARTRANGGVIAARCPACGAELRLGLDGTCAHCKASVTNGSVDWVVVDVQPRRLCRLLGGFLAGIRGAEYPRGCCRAHRRGQRFLPRYFRSTGQDGVSRAAGSVVQAEPRCRPRIHESGRLFHLERAA